MGIAVRPPVASVHRDLPVPPAVVWRLLVEVEQWPRWGPSVRRAALDDGAAELSAGAQGTVWTAVGPALRFRVTEFEPGRRWTWAVAGVRATGHEVTATPEGCRVRFDVPVWAAPYLPVCAIALARIEKLAQSAQ